MPGNAAGAYRTCYSVKLIHHREDETGPSSKDGLTMIDLTQIGAASSQDTKLHGDPPHKIAVGRECAHPVLQSKVDASMKSRAELDMETRAQAGECRGVYIKGLGQC